MGVSSALGSSALLPAGLGFRNVLINGSMDIWQRGTSFAGTAGIVYSADRWFTYRAAGATGHTASRQTGPTNFQYCLRMQRDSGNTSTADIYLEQDVESANSYAFAGKQFVLSFWARAGSNYSSASSLLTAQVWTGTGTDQRIQSGFTGGTTPGNSSVTLTTTWQQFYVYGVAAASTTQLGVRFGYTPVGTASTNDYFEVTGVQLEANYQPTPFEQLPIGVELALCQRYYEKSYDVGTTPGTNTNLGAQHISLLSDGGGRFYHSIYFKVPKRTNNYSRQVYTISGTEGSWSWFRNGASGTIDMNTSARGEGSIMVGNGLSVGAFWTSHTLSGHWFVNAEL
jgi:hypothetical protein